MRYQDVKNLLEIKSELTDVSPKARERQAEEKSFFDNDTLPFNILHQFKGIFKIHIKEYQSPELDPVFQAGIIKADLKEGHLDLVSAVKFSAGFIAAGMNVIAAEVPRLNATIKISEVNATDLFQGIIEDVSSKILRPEKMISGELDGFAKLQSRGRSPEEIASHLSGKINLIMRDGYIGSLITEAMSLDILEAAAAWLANNPATDINCILIATDIENGKVHTNPLFISSDDANIVGGGTASLERATLYYVFRSLPKDFSITGASVPIVVKGSFLNPVLNVVTENLISTAIATILDPIISFIKDILPGIEPERGRTCLKLHDEIKRIDRKSEIFDNGRRRVLQ